MSYGFDPDEVVTTKIDLIDKDGFHGVGTADGGNSGGSGGNATGSSKTVFSVGMDNYHNKRVGFIVYLTKEDYPYLFDDAESLNLYPYAWALYTGESVDTSEVDVNGDMGTICINDKPIGSTTYDMNPPLLTKDFISFFGTFITDYSGLDSEWIPSIIPTQIAKGETVHVLIVFSKKNGTGNDNNYFLQTDAPWTIDPSDFEE